MTLPPHHVKGGILFEYHTLYYKMTHGYFQHESISGCYLGHAISFNFKLQIPEASYLSLSNAVGKNPYPQIRIRTSLSDHARVNLKLHRRKIMKPKTIDAREDELLITQIRNLLVTAEQNRTSMPETEDSYDFEYYRMTVERGEVIQRESNTVCTLSLIGHV